MDFRLGQTAFQPFLQPAVAPVKHFFLFGQFFKKIIFYFV
jgi:hypothetical protein